MSYDPNLPPQLANDSSFNNEPAPVLCSTCEGTGKDFYSCCGVDMRGKDLDICPKCLEHTGWDGIKNAESCLDCDGSGLEENNE